MPKSPSDIQDLVDNPAEQLHVELKRWLGIKDAVVRAKLAHHLAALCNHGGGYLIIGFEDYGSPSTPHPGDVSVFNHDEIAGIVERYLVPAFQCEVFLTNRPGSSEQYPVIRVPGHGSVPVCAKRNGPHDSKNIPQGVRQGEYYIRAPGPKSVAIESPEQWKALIHRCVLNERETVLTSIGKILQTPASSAEINAAFKGWHEKLHSYYLELLKASPADWPVSLEANHYQLSYRILGSSGSASVKGAELLEGIRSSGLRVQEIVRTGWSMFHAFTRDEIKPRFVIDDVGDNEQDAIETTLIGASRSMGLPDFWRITADGRASIIRPYREDRAPVAHLERDGLGPRMWLSPIELAREVFELVMHAKEIAKYFEGAYEIEFRCTWYG